MRYAVTTTMKSGEFVMLRIRKLFPSFDLSSLRKLPRDAVYFLAASFVNSVGMAIMWPLTTFYVHNVLGQSYGDAGMVVFFQSLFSVFGQLTGGQLYYRIGPKNMIAGSFVLAAVLLLLIAATDSWPLYIVCLSLFGFANGVAMPAMNAYVGFRWKAYRRELYNVMYVCNNFGVSVGAAVGGLVAAVSFSLTYAMTGGTMLLFAVFLFVFIRSASGDGGGDGDHASAAEDGAAAVARGMNKAGKQQAEAGMRRTDEEDKPSYNRRELLRNVNLYLFLSLGSMFYWITFQQWSTGVAPYMEENGLGMDLYSLLWTVNGIVIVLGQPMTSWMKRTFANTIGKQMLLSSLFTLLACLFIFAFHAHYVYLVIGMVLATFGEMLLLPAILTYLSERTGANAPFYMGINGGLANVGRMLGPLMFGHAFDLWGVNAVFLLGTISALIALLLFNVHRHVNRKPEPRSEGTLRPAAQ
ncbi:MFS transporter [Paenibacillus sp. CCS19]|uniref:MFS transporter n=1 Tax=Paenibacillus sp. CCS19 TaxID=3158387 RepID=UPI0025639DD1|nr:MFS transporter [Paenibacillus cellulosilyticus]GMK42048.1 MFS transporter [Paenibacillus cellulosilyticus]